jgi:phosphate transport system protein
MMQKFYNELATLKQRLVDMGEMGQTMIGLALQSLIDRDPELIREVHSKEKQMNRFHVEIDDEAIRLLAVYSPVAEDLRFLLMVSRINSELERIGDQTVNVCESVELLISQEPLKPLIDLPRMAGLVSGMVRGSMEAFLEKDADKAWEIWNCDDQVDELNDQIFRELLTYVAASPHNFTRAIALILTARALERIADHATNICEEVVYIVLGRDIRHMDGLDSDKRSFAGRANRSRK